MAKKRKTELDIESTAPVSAEAAKQEETAPQAAPTPQQEAEVPKKPRKPINKRALVIAGAIGAVLIVAVVVVATMTKGHKEARKEEHGKAGEKEKPKEVKPPPPPPVPPVKYNKLTNVVLQPFIFPYKGEGGGDSFIRVVFALQMSNEDVVSELEENLELIRNSVMFYMGTRDKRDLLDVGKRKEILQNMQYNMGRSLQSGRVDAILINEISVY